MPTYVYKCSECQTVFERFQRITEDPVRDCPNGHPGTVKRVMQPVGIAFKGAGFYVNDSQTSPTVKDDAGAGDGSAPTPASETPQPKTTETVPSEP